MDSAMWDERYSEVDLIWSTEPNMFLAPHVEGLQPGTALDLACGEGRNAIWLAGQGWTVTAVDFSPVGIEKAARIAGAIPIEWLVADATTFTADHTFDLVLIFYLHLMPEQFGEVLDRAVARLAPGGTLFGVGHAVRNLADGYSGPQRPELLWSEELIAPHLEGLDVVEMAEHDRPVKDSDETAIDLIVHARKPKTN